MTQDNRPEPDLPAALRREAEQFPRRGEGLPESLVTGWVTGRLSPPERKLVERLCQLDDLAYEQCQAALAALPTPAQVHLVKYHHVGLAVRERVDAARRKYGEAFLQAIEARLNPLWFGSAVLRPQVAADFKGLATDYYHRIDPRPGLTIRLAADSGEFAVDALSDNPDLLGQRLLVVLCGADRMEVGLEWGPIPEAVKQEYAKRRALFGETVKPKQIDGAYARRALSLEEVMTRVGTNPTILVLEENQERLEPPGER